MKFLLNFNKAAIFAIIEKRNIEITKLFLARKNFDFNLTYKIKEGDKIIELTLLQFAIYYGGLELIQLLLQSDKIDINKRSKEAIIKEEIEVFENTALYMAVEKRDFYATEALLKRDDIDINEESFHFSNNSSIESTTALDLAYRINDLEIIQLLLDKSKKDNSRNEVK